MTQQVASITSSHRGLKAFQSRLVGDLERKRKSLYSIPWQGTKAAD